ncbi:efflux RND transporter periplasmic adaptor subunit [Corynebacterium sp.]|uniref:efflux RND transporter periplasmic adaptor subunit n=1 Tax=Corynebacterium sp. TaxID=1720 RepID=UPI0026E02655|nr:efflux RND transporter periplasmic adaptor subunit [Corynebacterium sp.]MDO5512018.1 efflux RND transporter periplasmic adaptor subunit [Corynebacterium sp.]
MNPSTLLSDRRVIISLAVVLSLLVAGVAWALLRSGPERSVAANEYTELAPKEVVSKVPVTGTIESRHSVALSTPLSGPVETVHVRVGDRVQEGQILAEIDVSAVQKEIDSQLAQQITADASNLSAVENAQQQYQQLQESVEQGLHPQITAAQSGLRQADGQLTEAEQVFADKRANVDQGAEPELHTQAAAVETARRDVFTAALEAARAGMATVNAALSPEAETITPLLGELESDHRYAGANRNLTTAQENYEITLRRIDQELATQQRAVAQAFAAKTEAAVALEVAQLAARQQLDTNATAVEQARRGMAAAQSAAGQQVSRLQVDIAAREARAPMAGVVTAVGAKEGTPAAGPLVTVADPDRLVLKAKVKELEAGKLKVGNEVSFTTPSTGSREFRGRVISVSPVAESAPAEASAQTPRPEFPVEVEVTGDIKELRIGGSAKAQIIAEKADKALAVPREALVDDNGKYSVLVLRPSGGHHEVTKVPVTVGILTDFEATVTGVKAGDKVLNQAANHRDSVGQQVKVG